MNSESLTTILLDVFTKGDDEVVYSMMRVRVDCLRRATCPGCGWCNDLTLASRHSATRIVYKVNISQMQSDAALARQLGQDELVADMQMEEDDAALARQLLQEDELVANMRSRVIEESDAALARQLYHDDLVAAGGI